MELDKTMEIRFSNFFYNITKIFPYYGKGPIFPIDRPMDGYAKKTGNQTDRESVSQTDRQTDRTTDRSAD